MATKQYRGDKPVRLVKRSVKVVKGPFKVTPTTPTDAGPSKWFPVILGFLLGLFVAQVAFGAVPTDKPRCWALFTNQNRQTVLGVFKWHGACERWRYATVVATCEDKDVPANSERQAECYDEAPKGTECRAVPCGQGA